MPADPGLCFSAAQLDREVDLEGVEVIERPPAPLQDTAKMLDWVEENVILD